MKRVESKQRGVTFLWCPNPITIDKSIEWGEGNFQTALSGAFLKVNDGLVVSHPVQPNAECSAPLGWVQTEKDGVFDKCSIYVDTSKQYDYGDVVTLDTADGTIAYNVMEPSYICYNELDGNVDYSGPWVQTVKNIEKNYIF